MPSLQLEDRRHHAFSDLREHFTVHPALVEVIERKRLAIGDDDAREMEEERMRREEFVRSDERDGHDGHAGFQRNHSHPRLRVEKFSIEASGPLREDTDYLSLTEQIDSLSERRTVGGLLADGKGPNSLYQEPKHRDLEKSLFCHEVDLSSTTGSDSRRIDVADVVWRKDHSSAPWDVLAPDHLPAAKEGHH